ncbi:MAG: hypothetical protein M3N29_04900 [Chloroflexota bacterium]|nr:hypothetical protein [Chloroflexota bacterium]
MQNQDRPGQGKPGAGKASPRAKAALARVAEALSDPQRRQSFRGDPAGTVRDYGELPESVRGALEGMSEEELNALAKAHRAFADAGFYVDIEDEYGGGRVSFF